MTKKYELFLLTGLLLFGLMGLSALIVSIYQNSSYISNSFGSDFIFLGKQLTRNFAVYEPFRLIGITANICIILGIINFYKNTPKAFSDLGEFFIIGIMFFSFLIGICLFV